MPTTLSNSGSGYASSGYGSSYGDGSGSGGSGSGYGSGYGDGYGYGYGDGYGYGYGDGYGSGFHAPVGECGGYQAHFEPRWSILRIGCEVHTLAAWISGADDIDAKHGDGIAGATRELAQRLQMECV